MENDSSERDDIEDDGEVAVTERETEETEEADIVDDEIG
jgi:hypothetical protein